MRSLIILLLLTRSAYAWDGIGMWYRAANADDPGGGGILGTGGAHDHGITCRDCHTDRVDNPSLRLDFAFSPALPTVAGAPSYTPGQRYTVTVDLQNATLAMPCTMPYTQNVDNFAAAFEDDTGNAAGMLESDSGQSAASCPAAAPDPQAAGTTGLYADCKVILAKGKPNLQRWTFYWTAPASGTVRLHYGAVDGNCDMMSMRDAVVVGSQTLAKPPGAAINVAAILGGAAAGVTGR